MKLWENIKLAFTSLVANKMRALLTMLGIIIGIGSVIGIMTLGDSLTGYMSSSMQGMGANNVTIMLRNRESGSTRRVSPTERDLITDEMIDQIIVDFPGVVDAVSISESVGSGRTTAGRRYANLSLAGVNDEYLFANNIALISGRFLNDEIDAGKKVAVVSDKLVANMFGDENPLGQQITITVGQLTATYTIVGVYQYDASMMGFSMASDQDISTQVFIPLTTAQRITGNHGYASVTIVTASSIDSEAFSMQLEGYLNTLYYSRNKSYQIMAFSMESMLNTLTDMLATIQTAIAAIAAISLLVGGIGVMNIMLVSITERTREIGTRKALGATNGEIRIQFIVEAIIICLVGGAIGIVLGILLGMFGASLLGFPAKASVFSMLLATGFSLAIGVFFGYYPANKAAQLDPIEALRYE